MKKYKLPILAALLLVLAGLLFWAFRSHRTTGVHFDADFESGNLGQVELLGKARLKVSPKKEIPYLSYLVHGRFDPDNPVDTSLAASANWYYFRMTGTKGKQIHIFSPDNGVPRTSYSYDGVHWDHLPLAAPEGHLVDHYFTGDTVFIALYEPYTYSYLQERLKDWCARPDVTLDTIGFSHEGRPMQLMHVTDPSVPTEKKARIWIHGRQHPSETPASYLVDGLVEYLTADTPEGRALRQQMDVYILPFANPDGVADGCSRSNAIGVNQEINFGRSDDSTVVEVKAIKETMARLTQDRPFDFMINSHSQHSESATFWVHKASTTSPAYFRKLWTFTGLACSFNPCLRPLDLNFSDMASRYVEGWCWDHFGESTVALTIETTYNCYSFDRDGLWADNDNIRAFGKRTMQAMAEYLGLSLPGRYVVETPAKMESGWERLPGESQSFMGKDAWRATRAGASIHYTMDPIPAGCYQIYRYVAGECIEPKGSELKDPETGEWLDPGTHGWVYKETVSQPRNGRFVYTYQAPAAGDLADALLLVRCDSQNK